MAPTLLKRGAQGVETADQRTSLELWRVTRRVGVVCPQRLEACRSRQGPVFRVCSPIYHNSTRIAAATEMRASAG